MHNKTMVVIELLITLSVGGIFLLYPWIVRKGLLFGVYAGEKAFEGEAARRIMRSWYAWMTGIVATSLAVGVGVLMAASSPPLLVLPLPMQLVAFLLLCLRAHFQARAWSEPLQGRRSPTAWPTTGSGFWD